MLNVLTALQDAVGGLGGDVGAGLAIIGAGLVVMGTGMGIGRIGGHMTEAMARQPEAGGNIQTAAIILAVFIEGVALFGLVIAGFIK